ncbi:hypothetical protein ACWTU8_30390 [Mesorhizobium sp. BHbdii]
MRLPRPERSFRFLLRIDVQNDLRHFAPVALLGRGVQKADPGEQTLFIEAGQGGRGRRLVGDIGRTGVSMTVSMTRSQARALRHASLLIDTAPVKLS